MQQTIEAAESPDGQARRLGWAPAGLLVVSAVAVLVAALATAGVLAPNFWPGAAGSGQPPGTSDGFAVVRNVSWRAWKVTVGTPPDRPDMLTIEFRIAAARDDATARRLAESWMQAAGGSAPPRRGASGPITVPRGGALLVYVDSLPRQKCAATTPPALHPSTPSWRARPVLSISTPLGTRHFRPSIWLNACHA